MTKVSVFNNVKTAKAKGKIDVDRALEVIKSESIYHQDVLKVRDGKLEYKHKIPVITWNGLFLKRSNNSVVSFSDYVYCDFDEVNPEETKLNLSKIDEVKAAWTSVSGKGCGALIKSSNINKVNFRSTCESIHKYLEERDLHADTLVDIARCNVMSYDPNMFIREQPKVYEPVNVNIEEEVRKLHQPEFKNILLNDEYNFTACNISLAYTYKKGLSFVEGERHHFTVTYFGLCNQFGVPFNYAYNHAMENNCVSKHTYTKAEKLYKAWSNQHGIKQVHER